MGVEEICFACCEVVVTLHCLPDRILLLLLLIVLLLLRILHVVVVSFFLLAKLSERRIKPADEQKREKNKERERCEN